MRLDEFYDKDNKFNRNGPFEYILFYIWPDTNSTGSKKVKSKIEAPKTHTVDAAIFF